jgi:probable HAF family extracellular repeat protein
MDWLADQYAVDRLCDAWLRLFLDSAVKGLALLALAGGLHVLLRRFSSATRHLVFGLTFFCLFLMPFCPPFLPQWTLPILKQPRLAVEFSRPLTETMPWAFWLFAVWFAGFGVIVLRIAMGLHHIRQVRREAAPVTDPQWLAEAAQVAQEIGLQRKFELLLSDRLDAAMLAGLRRAAVVLPVPAEDWPAASRLVILRHELGHLKRRDNLTNLAALLVCAVYWFNPLVWWAFERLRVCREGACDDLVLSAGVKPSEYVACLLDVVSPQHLNVPSVSVSQGSALKSRLLAILNPALNRVTLGRGKFASAVGLAILTLIALGALQPWIVPSLSAGLEGLLGPFRTELERPPAPGRGRLISDLEQTSSRALNVVAAFFGLSEESGKSAASEGPSLPTAPRTVGDAVVAVRSGDSPHGIFRASGRASHAFRPLLRRLGPMAAGGPPLGEVAPLAPGTTPDSDAYGGGASPSGDGSVWEVEVARTMLGTLGGDASNAVDINESGQVVGASSLSSGNQRAFIWNEGEGMKGIPCPDADCAAVDVNNLGQVLVLADTQAGVSQRSYVWSAREGLTDLGSLGGGLTKALALNDRGQVVGTSRSVSSGEHAFFWSRETGIKNLGGLSAVAVNEAGQVVGWASSYSFFWDPSTGFSRIGEVGVTAKPFAMNNHGEVVGYAAFERSAPPRAFLWTRQGGITDLGAIGDDVSSCAYRINDAGEILGMSADSAGNTRSFLRTRDGAVSVIEVPALLNTAINLTDADDLSVPSIPIGSSASSTLLWLDQVGRVEMEAQGEPDSLAQVVKTNGRGQIVGNFQRPQQQQSQAVLWELHLTGVEMEVERLLAEVRVYLSEQRAPLFDALRSARRNLQDAEPRLVIEDLKTFLNYLRLLGGQTSLPESVEQRWEERTNRILEGLSDFYFYDSP